MAVFVTPRVHQGTPVHTEGLSDEVRVHQSLPVHTESPSDRGHRLREESDLQFDVDLAQGPGEEDAQSTEQGAFEGARVAAQPAGNLGT